MPLLSTYSAGSIRGWRAAAAGGTGGITVPGRLVTATWNDNPSNTGAEDTLAYYTDDFTVWNSTDFYENEAYAIAYSGQTLIAVGGDGITASPSFSISTDNGSSWAQSIIIPDRNTGALVDVMWYRDRFLALSFTQELWTIVGQTYTRVGVAKNTADRLEWLRGRINWGVAEPNTGQQTTLVATSQRTIYTNTSGSFTASDWTPSVTLGGGQGFVDIAIGEDLIVAISNGSVINVYYSSDNETWQTTSLGAFQGAIPAAIVYDGEKFIIAAEDGALYTSTNAAFWTRLPLSLNIADYGIVTRMIWNGSNIWGVVSSPPPGYTANNGDSLIFVLSDDLATVEYRVIDLAFINSIINVAANQPSKG